MQLLHDSLHFVTHLPEALQKFSTAHGAWTYGLLFVIVFAETGLVFAPFLPGDSLLFAAGALVHKGVFNLWLVSLVLFTAAVLGDAVNYHVGKFLGPKLAAGKRVRLINPKHLARTHEFFEKYGGKTIVLARFVPIVRTFAPFVAGMGEMNYGRFLFYNVIGAAMWTIICVGAGYIFGGIPFVEKNFELVLVGIIVVSCVPMVVEILLARRRTKAARRAADNDRA